MSAKVGFLSQPASDADQRPVLAVHPDALDTREGRAWVWRLAAGVGAEAAPVLQALPVVPGRRLGEVVELAAAPGAPGAPLKAGDKLVLRPAAELRPGQTVRVAPPAAAR
jgi:hypothetical protein